jgi:hypothetical protein
MRLLSDFSICIASGKRHLFSVQFAAFICCHKESITWIASFEPFAFYHIAPGTHMQPLEPHITSCRIFRPKYLIIWRKLCFQMIMDLASNHLQKQPPGQIMLFAFEWIIVFLCLTLNP